MILNMKILCTTLVFILMATGAAAQSLQVSCATIPPIVRYMHVISKIEMRFATTHVISYVTNVANRSQEIIFRTQLPKRAYITGFVMEVNGVPFVGEVKERDEANRDYQDAKQKGLSAGHITTKPSKPTEFKLELSISARSKVRFNLTYQELLQRDEGFYKHAISIKPDYTVEKVRVDVIIADRERLKNLYVVAGDDNLVEKGNEAISLMEEADYIYNDIPRKRSKRVQLLTHITLYDTTGMIAVLYDLSRKRNAGQVEVAGGYFVHFFAADDLDPGNRHIVFVLDKSGSMGIENDRVSRMDQLREAMRIMLGTLKDSDKFNIVMFDSIARQFETSLVTGTIVNRQRAIDYIYHTDQNPGGWTNIEAALKHGLDALNAAGGDPYYSMMFFLTDGEATEGDQNTTSLLLKVQAWNQAKKHRTSTLAFGGATSYGFLQKLALQNGGLARKIFLDSYVAPQIQGYFKKVSQVVMKNINVTYSANVTNLATNKFVDEFHVGDEFVFLGKTMTSINQLLATVSGTVSNKAAPISRNVRSGRGWNRTLLCSSTKRHQLFLGGVSCRSLKRGPGRISSHTPPDGGEFSVTSPKGFLERMHAYQTVQELLHKAKSASNPANGTVFTNQAMRISLKYQFVTPLTSMILKADDVKNMSMAFPPDAYPVVDSWDSTDEEDIFGTQGGGPGAPIVIPSSRDYEGFFENSHPVLDDLDPEELIDELKHVPIHRYGEVKWGVWFPKFVSALNYLGKTEIEALPWADIWIHVDNTTAERLCWEVLKDIPPEAWADVPLSVVQNLYPYALSSLPVETLQTIPLNHLLSLDPKRYSAFTTDVLSAVSKELFEHAMKQVTGWIKP